MEAQAASAGPFPVPGLTPPAKRTGVKRRIGDVIVQLGFAERELVESVVQDGRRDGLPLGQARIEAGIVNSGQLARAVASPEDIDALIENLGRLESSVHEIEEEEVEAQVIELRESADDAPVVKLVHAVIADAVRRGASDIHFEPNPNEMRVRCRVDGVVFDSTTVPRHLASGLVSRIKIMAELDIAEKRMPQDGRIGLSVDGNYVDLRGATLPVVRGEAVVMRILDSGTLVMTLDSLGMEASDRKRFESAIGGTHGATLVTGPTRPGQTTTPYAPLTA